AVDRAGSVARRSGTDCRAPRLCAAVASRRRSFRARSKSPARARRARAGDRSDVRDGDAVVVTACRAGAVARGHAGPGAGRVMERVGDAVSRELGRFGPIVGMAPLVEAWPSAVGTEIARNAWPARLARDGTLHVHTTDSIWAFEL